MRALALALTALLATAPMADAQSFFGRGRGMTSEDMELFNGAVSRVLEQHQAGASAQWSNPKTGRTGTATAKRLFEKDGMPCAEVETLTTSQGHSDQTPYTLVMCRTAEGWKNVF